MLTSVQMRNFKSFLHGQMIDLEPLTVFVGANASGKTSVLDAIWIALITTLHGKSPLPGLPEVAELQRPSWDLDGLYTRGAQGDLIIGCLTEIRKIRVSARPFVSAGQRAWELTVAPPPNPVFAGDAPAPHDYAVPKPDYLKLNRASLAKATYLDQFPPRMISDGEGLASVLAHMALSNRSEFDTLCEEMRQVIPQFKGIRFSKQKIQRTETELVRFGDDTVERQIKRDFQGDSIHFDFQNAKNISAHLVSEGTLILLGLLTVLLGPSRPDILLLDDIEHGLHPLAQKTLLEILAKIMGRFPNLQVLATAHSPYLIDWLKPEQVRLLALGPDGYSVCGKLTERPRYEKWKAEMAPGEMWSLFGDKWVAEGGHAK